LSNSPWLSLRAYQDVYRAGMLESLLVYRLIYQKRKKYLFMNRMRIPQSRGLALTGFPKVWSDSGARRKEA
jgi:hypothetical protein